MAQSAFGRLKADTPRSTGGNEYLKGGDMATEMIPFGITRVKWDEGNGYMGADRWLLDVYAWYEGDLLTNDEETGKLGLHPGSRDALMERMQTYIKKNGALGPVVLVKIKTAQGRNPFLDLASWDEENQRPMLDADQEPEEEDEPLPPPARRPQRSYDNPPSRRATEGRRRVVEEPPDEPDDDEGEDAPPTPRGGAAARSRAQGPVAQPAPARPRRASVASPSDDEGDEDNTVPFVAPAEDKDQPRRDNVSTSTIRQWAIAQGYQVGNQGKLSKEVKDAYWEAHDAYYEGQGVQKPPAAANPVVSRPRPAPAPEGAAKQLNPKAVPPTSNHGPAAQEMVYTPGQRGQSTEECPGCGKIVEGHMFPAQDGSGAMILHMCSNGVPQPLHATAIVEEG